MIILRRQKSIFFLTETYLRTEKKVGVLKIFCFGVCFFGNNEAIFIGQRLAETSSDQTATDKGFVATKISLEN